MKKLLFFFILFSLFFSCKKESKPPAGSQVVSGTLYYSDPAVDGAGLFYETDSEENLIFKEDTSDIYSQYIKYKNFVGIHSRLTFTDTGETGCLSGMIPGPCSHPLRIVKVVKLEKQ
jgi:hypothetical protein